MADGNHIEVARAFVTIVPSLENSQKIITEELTGVTTTASKEAGEKSGKHLGENLAKGLKTTAAVIGAAMTAATAAAIGTGKAFIDAANSTAKLGDEIQKNSQKMNLSYSGYQELDYILQRNGSSITNMKSAMLTLTKAAEGGNEAFKTLGISQEELAKMNPEQTFNATIKALQNVQDEGQRTVLANKLLGKSAATELGPTLRMTADEMEAMRKQAHDLGGVMSDEAVESAAKYQDELLNMQTALTGVKNNMMSKFLPGISAVMNGLSLVFSGKDGIGQIQSGLESVIQNITAMAPQFFSLASTLINGLLAGFAPMLPQLVSSIFGFIQTGLLMFVQLIPQLTPVISEGLKGIASALLICLPVLTSALLDMVRELVTWLSSGDNVKTFTDGILALVSTLVQGFGDLLPVLLPAVVNIIGQVANSLTEPKNVNMIIQSTLYIIGAVAVAIVKAIPELAKAVLKVLTNTAQLLKEWGGQIVGKIGPWLASVWASISSWFASLPSKLSSAFSTAKSTIKGWATSAVTWGADMIKGFIKGITNKAKDLGNAVKNLAKNYISKFLHFSVPDAGPLADADTWMPDFVNLMAKGIEQTAPKLQAAVMDLAGGMSTTITAHATDGVLGDNVSNYNGGDVTINVYASEGQNVNELAEVIAVKLQNMTARKGAVYA